MEGRDLQGLRDQGQAKQQLVQAKTEKVAEQARTKDEAKERARHDDAEKALREKLAGALADELVHRRGPTLRGR